MHNYSVFSLTAVAGIAASGVYLFIPAAVASKISVTNSGNILLEFFFGTFWKQALHIF